MSGEDWKDVELTLSTASPALSAAAPGLAPFEVAALHLPPAGTPGSSGPMPPNKDGDVVRSLSELKGRQQKAVDALEALYASLVASGPS